jgi:maltokinase
MSARSPAPGASATVARRHAPSRVTAGRERAITVDQTNVSVVVDEQVVVKWLDPAVRDPHPAVRTLEHLRLVGFDDVPELHGVEVVDGWVVALVTQYLPGARDGWEWFVDDVIATLDDPGGACAERSAGTIGALAARLHVALATPSSVLPTPISLVDVAPEWQRGRTLLADARELADGWPAEVLARRAERIGAILDHAPELRVPGIRVHGDLHVGQILRTGSRLAVIDFEGNPLLSGELVDASRPPAVDLASLLQSVDHACRVVERRRQVRAGALDDLAARLQRATLASYRDGLATAGLAELADERLLTPLRLIQELHELVYASRHLPHWADVAARTLSSMLPDEAIP